MDPAFPAVLTLLPAHGFGKADEYRAGVVQNSFDKQFVRNWLTSPASGWDRYGSQPPPPLPDPGAPPACGFFGSTRTYCGRSGPDANSVVTSATACSSLTAPSPSILSQVSLGR